MARFTAYQIKNWNHTRSFDLTKDASDVIGKIPQINLPVRSDHYKSDSFLIRFKLAWKVFKGEYDAVEWRDDNQKAINDYDIKSLKQLK